MLPSVSHLALEDLGWASFQDLAMAYAEDLFGAPVTTFAKVWDGGVDGEHDAFTVDAASTSRRWAIQAKHTARPSSLAEASLAGEFEKVPALAAEGFDAYLIVTNHTVSRAAAKAIRSRVLAAGFRVCHVHGRSMVARRIRSSSRLRALAPRVYGVGDLSMILDERRAEQTAALLDASRPELDRFVVTEPYRAAVRALRQDGVVVLLGEPAAGKSTIARVLSVAARDTFGADPYVLHRLDELSWHWNPANPARLFWIDDVFGSTQAEFGAAETFNRRLSTLATALDRGNRFVFTSRTYIWRAVAPQLKLSSAPRFSKGIVEVRVEDFSARDRALILANHVRLGDQSVEWRRSFKALAPDVARHARFTPEVARRLGLQAFTEKLDLSRPGLKAFVENPGSYLEELIGGLAPAGQAALALLFMHGGELPVALPRDEALEVVVGAFGVTASRISNELAALDGSLCRRDVEDEEPIWRFRHPSIGEVFATVASRSPVLLDVYLRGAPAERMLNEVVCAGVDVDGAIVEVGRSHYDLLIKRMKDGSWWKNPRIPRWFVLTRTTADFRRRYFTAPLAADHPILTDGRRMEHQTLALIAVLQPENLVDPAYVTYMRGRLRKGLLEMGHPPALSRWARDVLGHKEFNEILVSVVENLREDGASYMEYWEPERNSEVSPSDAFRGLIEFAELLEMYIDPEEAAEILGIVNERVDARVKELDDEAERDEWHRREEEYYARRAGAPPRSAPVARPEASLFLPPAPDLVADVFSDIDE